MKLVSGIIAALFLAAFAVASQASDEAERFVRMGWSNTDFSRTTVPLSEVMSGGPPRDGIPPIDNPQFQPASSQNDLTAKDPVISIEINGDARAYPLRILIWHEIVNDTVGGKPVAVTYCPLCNAAIVFDRMVDGELKDFGTTGLLRNSDLIMYDRQSESWWQQFTGKAIAGSQVGSSLKFMAARLESWAEFTTRFPDGRVLVPNNPGFRNYGRNPYVGYDSAAAPFLYRGKMPEGISPMARVVVYRINGKVNAIALSMLSKAEELMHGNVTLKWKAGQASALDTGEIAEGRDVGSIIVQKKNASGSYEDIPYDVTFAFVVEAFEPGTVIKK
ncbi:MAG: DUF3179 domain-containing protein [Pseudomonadota bacterium]